MYKDSTLPQVDFQTFCVEMRMGSLINNGLISCKVTSFQEKADLTHLLNIYSFLIPRVVSLQLMPTSI